MHGCLNHAYRSVQAAYVSLDHKLVLPSRFRLPLSIRSYCSSPCISILSLFPPPSAPSRALTRLAADSRNHNRNGDSAQQCSTRHGSQAAARSSLHFLRARRSRRNLLPKMREAFSYHPRHEAYRYSTAKISAPEIHVLPRKTSHTQTQEVHNIGLEPFYDQFRR